MKRNKKGFTLVELVIVIAVIAILAAVLLPTFSGIVTRARKSSALQRATSVKQEVLGQYFTSGADLNGLVIYVHTPSDNYKFTVTGNELKEASFGNNEEIPEIVTTGATPTAKYNPEDNLDEDTDLTTDKLYRMYGTDVTVVIPEGVAFGLNADTTDLYVLAD